MLHQYFRNPILVGLVCFVLALFGSHFAIDTALIYLLGAISFVLLLAGSISQQSDRLWTNLSMQDDTSSTVGDEASKIMDTNTTESRKDKFEMTDHDVFICHASEDKLSVVEPIVAECEKRSVNCWYDKNDLNWGDDLVGAIARGVQKARFVLVVASEHAAGKGWPLREISQAIEREVRQKQTVVLPLFVGDRERLLAKTPQLDGKLGKKWENNPDEVADEIAKLLGQGKCPSPTDVPDSITTPLGGQTMPHLPPIPKTYTDQDRNRFVRDAFRTITGYFESAANQYNTQKPRITSETERLDQTKFALVLYLDGTLKSQCQIWIDSNSGRCPTINYFDGRNSFNDYNARNEIVSMIETEDGLKLKGSMGSFSGGRIKACPPYQAAEILWRRFAKTIRN